MKVSRRAVYDWLTDEERKQFMAEGREIWIDEAEEVLMKNIKDQKETSLIFFLKTQAKSRGYGEKEEVIIDDKPVLGKGKELPADED